VALGGLKMSNTRLQIEISSTRAEEISVLMETFDIGTKKDLFNNAISLLQWAGKELKRGRIIGSIDQDTESYNELSMPIFSNIENESDESKERAA